MEEWINVASEYFTNYVNSFKNLTEEQKKNFTIKKDHSFRVAENSILLAKSLKLNLMDTKIAWLAGLFHDLGRFNQLVDHNTFNDSMSFNHAEQSVEILKQQSSLKQLGCDDEELIYVAIQLHNQRELPKKISERELLFAQLLRDADKLDILKVLTDYYTNRNSTPNHTLTWELPKGNDISAAVRKNILSGKLVSKNDVVSEMDVKIMQLSWVYDINFKLSFEFILTMRYLEKIYNSLPKTDSVINIYRTVKIFAQNKIMD